MLIISQVTLDSIILRDFKKKLSNSYKTSIFSQEWIF